MNETTTNPGLPKLDYQRSIGLSPPLRPVPVFEAIIHCGLGVLLPVVCFIASASNYPALDQPWQSGGIDVYAGLIPRAACAWPFYPFLLYSMFSLTVALFFPDFTAERFVIRFGVYIGMLLALQFVVIEWICLGSSSIVFVVSVFTVVILWGLFEILRRLFRRYPRKMAILSVGLAAVVAVCVLPYAAYSHHFYFFNAALFVLAAAPALTLATYLTVSRAVSVDASTTRRMWIVPIWLGGYSAAWWASIVCVLNEYAKLPKTQPSGCYVVTAAAGGHSWLVGSTSVVCIDGSIGVNNTQLRRLKCAEIMLAKSLPRAHFQIRRIYDRIGPIIARRLTAHRWACDLAYLSLKPAEWLVVAIIRQKLRRSPRLARRLLG